MRRLAILVVLLSVSTVAHAQTDDLSHINGHPVPVGDHNQYHYRFARMNISTNPVGWVLGLYGVSLSYAFHDNFALRGDISLYAPVGSEDRGYELGVAMPVYFRRAYSGFFVEPGLIYRSFSDYEGEATIGPQMLVGWHWIWDSKLNVSFALGAGRNFSTQSDEGELFANGYFRVGYAF